MDPQKLSAVYPPYSRPINGDGVLCLSLPPEVHHMSLDLTLEVEFLAIRSRWSTSPRLVPSEISPVMGMSSVNWITMLEL